MKCPGSVASSGSDRPFLPGSTNPDKVNGVSLTTRLLAAAGYARKGGSIADIGTDHAYLPIYLVSNGISKAALACDVRKGPLDRANENIKAAGLENKILTKLTDGLSGVESFSPDDIFLCGMGGELIVSIIEKAAFVRSEGKRLIVQPMTHAEIVRRYLALNGFSITDEAIVSEKGNKLYQIIVAAYTGIGYELDEAELILGPLNIKNQSPELELLTDKAVSGLQTKLKGIKTAGGETAAIQELIDILTKKGKRRKDVNDKFRFNI